MNKTITIPPMDDETKRSYALKQVPFGYSYDPMAINWPLAKAQYERDWIMRYALELENKLSTYEGPVKSPTSLDETAEVVRDHFKRVEISNDGKYLILQQDGPRAAIIYFGSQGLMADLVIGQNRFYQLSPVTFPKHVGVMHRWMEKGIFEQ